ncbi:MAG: histidine kinase dimerization/phospho-acceptor domain-containing protein [Cellulosilyticaceae bacterium]
MRHTLRGRILIGIIGVILIVFFTVNVMIWQVFKSNLDAHIINDLDKITSITYTSLQNMPTKGSFDKKNSSELLLLFGKIARSYEVYIGLKPYQSETITFTGRLLSQEQYDQAIGECEGKSASVYIGNIEEQLYATYAYPTYIEDKYVGDIILQKEYTDEYLNYKKIMTQIMIVEGICYVMMIACMYGWLTQVTLMLRHLADGMNQVVSGDFEHKLNIRGTDEIAQLAGYFNEMQHEIREQIETIVIEKEQIEILEKETKNFFNYATHEMKTPLTAIKGYGELLQENQLDVDTVSIMASRVVIEADRMHKLVENMLVVARGQEQSKESEECFDLKILIEEVVDEYGVVVQKHGKKMILELESYMIYSRRNEIRTVLTNLIDNAIKYSSSPEIHIQALSQNQEGYKIIFMNQIGEIPEHIANKLLEPFVKYNYQDFAKVSSGLGLFICNELINKNGYYFGYEVVDGWIHFIITVC